jgi:hypothetical protein
MSVLELCKCSTMYTFKLTNLYIHVFMAETFETMFSCSLSCTHFAPEMKDLKQHMMRKTEVTKEHEDTPCGY